LRRGERAQKGEGKRSFSTESLGREAFLSLAHREPRQRRRKKSIYHSMGELRDSIRGGGNLLGGVSPRTFFPPFQNLQGKKVINPQ